MSILIDLSGKKFNRLTVIKRVNDDIEHKAQWLCKCDCGNYKIVKSYNLRSGKTKSCGCYRKEVIPKNKIHGKANTRLYCIWKNILKRCYKNDGKNYKNYGARGIKVCNEWHNDFMTFYNWAIANGYADNLTIDRIDVNGNYEPSNCRWITVKENSNNRRDNRFITYKNETHTATEWAEIYHIKIVTLYDRLNRGWSVEDALTKEVQKKRIKKV